MLAFDRWHETARFHNPLRDGALDEQRLEFRRDPLLDHVAVFSPGLAAKADILFPATDETYLAERAAATAGHCFMCGDRWREATPRYPEALLPGGRLKCGEAVLFPNLFPLARYHAVVRVGAQHHRRLDDFAPELLRDALAVALEFIVACRAHDPQAEWFTINANFLFPSGASATHPHWQVLGGRHPTPAHRRLHDCAATHHAAHGTNCFAELAAAERADGERWLGAVGGSRWFTAFAPQGPGEVQAIWPTAAGFADWDDEAREGFAQGLAAALRGCHRLGLSTFNFACFGAPPGHDAMPGRDAAGFRCFLRLVHRQNVVPHHRTDDYFYQKLLGGEIMVRTPEALAEALRGEFG